MSPGRDRRVVAPNRAGRGIIRSLNMTVSGEKLTIGVLGVEDPADVRSYSGTPFHLSHFLRAAGHTVRALGPYPLRYRGIVRVQNRLAMMTLDQQLLWERHALITAQYPEMVNKYVERNPDLNLLLATSAFMIAKVQTKLPVILWGDTTVAGVLGKYSRYVRLSERSIKRAHVVEQDGLNACDLAVFSNQWAADVAMSSYHLDPAKVRVITYGPGLVRVPDEAEIARLLSQRGQDRINLIIIGVDWERKGVAKAIEVTEELRDRGVDARLAILGCLPPPKFVNPGYVSLLGNISKFSTEGARQIAQLLGESHLLILPTVAECAAIALVEANAFGVPFLSTDVGGNYSLVRQNYNGILVPLGAGVSTWADAAISILRGRENYERFAWQAYDYFHERLSWEHAVSDFEMAVHELLGSTVLQGA
jgi:glycosyltransferase involved in cell wall biosynthesis